jgi:hypothetical protein
MKRLYPSVRLSVQYQRFYKGKFAPVVNEVHSWKRGEMEVQLHAFLNSALDGDEWSASCSNRFNPGVRVPKYLLNWRLGVPQSRSGRGGEEKNSHHCPYRELNSGHPARSLVTTLSRSIRRGAPNSNLARVIGYPVRRFPWFSSGCPGELWHVYMIAWNNS